jgi:hypothetical protein
MTPKDHAITLLAQGIPTSQVAAACGVSDSYISQLKADPEIQEQILAKQAAHSAADVKFDEMLEDAEAMALDKIKKNLPFASMGQALAAFRILNGARRRQDEVQQAETSVSLTVNLSLPATALPRYITNTSNEIVEVEGKTMISATAKTLDQILAARAGGDVSLPQTTSLEKAAELLDRLAVPRALLPVAKARRSPVPLSPDVL